MGKHGYGFSNGVILDFVVAVALLTGIVAGLWFSVS